jgi:hypothetical protein
MSDNSNLLFALAGLGVGYFVWKSLPASAQQTAINDINTATVNLSNAAMIAATGSTRGERNNNPGNIQITKPPTAWQGLSPTQNDPTFVQFTAPTYGIRAIHKVLLNYASQGMDTVTQVISTWSTTDQAAYIANVAAALGVSPYAVIDLTNLATATAVAAAIIMQENGRNIYLTNGQLTAGMALS